MKIYLPLLLLSLSILATSAHADVIVSETFGGSGAALDGTSTEFFDPGIAAAGGSGVWDSSTDYLDNGNVINSLGNSSAFIGLGSYINDTKGQSNGLFTLEWTVADITTAGNRWLSVGFSNQTSPSNNSNFLAVGGVGTIILRSAGDADAFSIVGQPAILGPQVNGVAHTLTIELDLRDHNGVDNFGTATFSTNQAVTPIGSFNYTSDVNFNSILLSNNNDTAGTLSGLTLHQVSAIPEPSSAMLLGIVSLFSVRRRRK